MKRSRALIGALAASALVLTACGGGESEGKSDADATVSLKQAANYTGADRDDFLLKCAKTEGVLDVYTSQNPTLVDDLRKGFIAKYPGIKVNATRRTSPQTAEAFTKEAKAGVNKADIVHLKVEVAESVLDLFTSFTSPELKAYPDSAIGPDGKYVSSGRVPYGAIYNTDKVSAEEAPKTPQDLLDPKWKGKIALSTTGPGTQWVGWMEKRYGEDFIKAFGKQDVRTTEANTNAITGQVAAGESLIAPAVNLSGVAGIMETDKNAPVKWVPMDPQWAEDSVAIAAKAPHPCASMLYTDYVLSLEGQTVNPAYESSRTDATSSPELAGIEPASIWDAVGSHDAVAYQEASKRWTDLIDRYIIN